MADEEKTPASSFIGSKRILDEYKAASSLPNTTPTVAEPNPVVPVIETPAVESIPPVIETPAVDPALVVETPVVEPPPAEPVVEPPVDDFSVDLPSLDDSSTEIDSSSLRHPDSPLKDEDPEWAHQLATEILNDPVLSDGEKKDILATNPKGWTRLRRNSKDASVLGKFRDEGESISKVVEALEKQSKTRSDALKTHYITSLLNNPTEIDALRENDPKTLSRIMASLVEGSTEFVSDILKRKGYDVVKAGAPVDKAAIMARLKENPLWSLAEGTDLETALEAEFQTLVDKASQGVPLDPDQLAEELKTNGNGLPSLTQEQAQVTYTALNEVRENVWLKTVQQGLESEGIKPATQAEVVKNPVLAQLKNMVFNAALRGLPGEIPDWDEQSYAWGEKQEGFKGTFEELQAYLSTGDAATFKANASSLNPFYYEFGKRRGKMAKVATIYRQIDSLLNGAPVVVPPPEPAVTTPNGNGAAPVGAIDTSKSQFLGDKRVLDRWKNQG